MELTRQTTINASADKVWKILGADFNNISEWASFVLESKADPDLPDGGGRVCQVAGFGATTESLYEFDDQRRKLGFTFVGKKNPFFMKEIKNGWQVEPKGEDQAVVHTDIQVKLMPVFKQLLSGPMSKMMGKRAEKILSELKYFSENGKALV